MNTAEHVAASTCHTRRGGPAHAFRYAVDYVLIDPRALQMGPRLFSRNRFNLLSVHDADHGSKSGASCGVDWAEAEFARRGLRQMHLRLLTQPRCLGYVFNPVSFWLAMDGDDLHGVIAEVNNTYGDRIGYFCGKDDLSEIGRDDRLVAAKLMHVSPFQDMSGGYAFQFDVQRDRIAIRIDYTCGDGGLVATLSGPRRPLSDTAIVTSLLRRPFGALRTIALIHWQALRLKLKGATFRPRPQPPSQEVN